MTAFALLGRAFGLLIDSESNCRRAESARVTHLQSCDRGGGRDLVSSPRRSSRRLAVRSSASWRCSAASARCWSGSSGPPVAAAAERLEQRLARLQLERSERLGVLLLSDSPRLRTCLGGVGDRADWPAVMRNSRSPFDNSQSSSEPRGHSNRSPLWSRALYAWAAASTSPRWRRNSTAACSTWRSDAPSSSLPRNLYGAQGRACDLRMHLGRCAL